MFLTQGFYKFVSETQVGVTYFVMRIILLVGDNPRMTKDNLPKDAPESAAEGRVEPNC